MRSLDFQNHQKNYLLELTNTQLNLKTLDHSFQHSSTNQQIDLLQSLNKIQNSQLEKSFESFCKNIQTKMNQEIVNIVSQNQVKTPNSVPRKRRINTTQKGVSLKSLKSHLFKQRKTLQRSKNANVMDIFFKGKTLVVKGVSVIKGAKMFLHTPREHTQKITIREVLRDGIKCDFTGKKSTFVPLNEFAQEKFYLSYD
ncbi:hypothetical protein M0813_01377 [Anaeramoeba flamelloides]|uniref:Uncharacterized protein n=1 Tax=Anaeramoeba flamelloides TaxID=1746091 RepID=A0ABQ8Z965_9EUKA|nr:hypothetical protein M0813_01377 [Anaeramoeba flamelloides]